MAFPLRLLILVLLATLAWSASAQPRAWLDRDRIALGETVTLNIETQGDVAPDYTPLQGEFDLAGHSSRRQFELTRGGARSRTLYAVALRPRREGVHRLPPLAVGGERTAPLTLTVIRSASAPAQAGVEVFIESEPDDPDPYVQQSVGWVVRLYSAVPLVSGELDQPVPAGASLQRVGDDAQYTRTMEGRTYTVIERRYLLVPERSGELAVPGARFEGRGAGGFFDDLFGDRGGTLQASAPARTLQVREVPANAPQPWLPLHALQLRYQTTPSELRAGAAATLTVVATADGATAAQMPELELPAVPGLQVFAEPVQYDETFRNGRPQVSLSRSYSLVPSQPGELRLPGLRLAWWDVDAGTRREAELPPLRWTVATGAAASPSSAPSAPAIAARPGDAPAAAIPSAVTGEEGSRPWIVLAAFFALLWLATLVWALSRKPAAPASASPPASEASGAGASAAGPAALRRALATGDFHDVSVALMGSATPPARHLDEVIERLADPRQREAVGRMQRARWADGDGPQAREALRQAFAQGPLWRPPPPQTTDPLPPLYPPS